MSFTTHLSLGRVSNLPTVWTNVLSAGALAGAAMGATSGILLIIAMSLFYVAGMYYNDACDSEYDAQHQAHRPIPSGLISRYQVEVFALTYGVVALLLVYAARVSSPLIQGTASIGWLLASLFLIACIVYYNRHHKDNPLSPLIMAGCRIAVLITTSYALAPNLPPVLFLAIFAMLAWLIGLTYLAKHEKAINTSKGNFDDRWPLILLCIPVLVGAVLSISSPSILVPLALIAFVICTAHARLSQGPAHLKGSAIALMIAGICLVDGIFLAWVWGIQGMVISVLAFGMTLSLQQWIAGT